MDQHAVVAGGPIAVRASRSRQRQASRPAATTTPDLGIEHRNGVIGAQAQSRGVGGGAERTTF
ncbi:hypothetical protein GCM10023320_03170 [Pseudonocardia adelaidensis]|uniref:Uncharacterized protein n=1 Tax=Pseudonocardia adelaidensis TaxID=648754 RepID=A0ABP9N970_9PSEU